MKRHLRILAIDDASLSFGDECVPIVGILARLPDYIEAVMTGEIRVDGTDSTDAIIGMVTRSRYKKQVRLILLDGVTFGGFNVVDICRLYSEIGIPIATVTRENPDIGAIRAALKKHFCDWNDRFSLVSRYRINKLVLGSYTLYSQYEGINSKELSEMLRNSLVRGAVPEPLRIAHLMATAMVKGESRGRA